MTDTATSEQTGTGEHQEPEQAQPAHACDTCGGVATRMLCDFEQRDISLYCGTCLVVLMVNIVNNIGAEQAQ